MCTELHKKVGLRLHALASACRDEIHATEGTFFSKSLLAFLADTCVQRYFNSSCRLRDVLAINKVKLNSDIVVVNRNPPTPLLAHPTPGYEDISDDGEKQQDEPTQANPD